jgi:proteasome assembly chaperone (PAC2) family protein
MEAQHANMDSCYGIHHSRFYPIVSPSSNGLCNPLVGNFYNTKEKKNEKKKLICAQGDTTKIKIKICK